MFEYKVTLRDADKDREDGTNPTEKTFIIRAADGMEVHKMTKDLAKIYFAGVENIMATTESIVLAGR